MNETDSGPPRLSLPENPYAPPTAATAGMLSESDIRLRAVKRVYSVIGWLGIVVYVPIVVSCIGSVIGILLGYPIGPLPVVAGASVFNSIVLAIAVLYVLTARRIAARDFTVRRQAVVLSFLMMIGFPLFTLVGAICYRYLRLHFSDQGAAAAEAGANA